LKLGHCWMTKTSGHSHLPQRTRPGLDRVLACWRAHSVWLVLSLSCISQTTLLSACGWLPVAFVVGSHTQSHGVCLSPLLVQGRGSLHCPTPCFDTQGQACTIQGISHLVLVTSSLGSGCGSHSDPVAWDRPEACLFPDALLRDRQNTTGAL